MAEANEEANPAAGGGAGSAPAVDADVALRESLIQILRSQTTFGVRPAAMALYIKDYGFLFVLPQPCTDVDSFRLMLRAGNLQSLVDFIKALIASRNDVVWVSSRDYKKGVITSQTKRYDTPRMSLGDVMDLCSSLEQQMAKCKKLTANFNSKEQLEELEEYCKEHKRETKEKKKAEIAKESEEAHKASVEKGKQKTAATAARLAAGEL